MLVMRTDAQTDSSPRENASALTARKALRQGLRSIGFGDRNQSKHELDRSATSAHLVCTGGDLVGPAAGHEDR
jgi:hypothetical protein